MKNYRILIENLYEMRSTKSGKKWLDYIHKQEKTLSEEKYIESNVFHTMENLKYFLYLNLNKQVSYKSIRGLIENCVKNYDENYIGELDQLLYILEYYSEIPEYKENQLLKILSKIFL